MDTKEKVKVMCAYIEGAEIEQKSTGSSDDEWVSTKGCPQWDWVHFEYRVKPTPTHKPYSAQETLFNDAIKHHFAIKNKRTNLINVILSIYSADNIVQTILGPLTYNLLFEDFVWADDNSVCGTPIPQNCKSSAIKEKK